MKAEIITIGDELLIGQVVDTNSAWMGEQLNAHGIVLHQITSVHDDRDHILAAIDAALGRADIVLTTGGLGPTKDDITKHVLCEYFGTTLVEDLRVRAHIHELYRSRPEVLNRLTASQWFVPQSATILSNRVGSAPIMVFHPQTDTRLPLLIAMPGVPHEMKIAMREQVLPLLSSLQSQRTEIVHKTLLLHGIAESTLALVIEAWEEALPSSMHLAYLPKDGLIRLRLSSYGEASPEAIEAQLAALKPLVKDYLLAEEDCSLETIMAKELLDSQQTIATAESCTGGRLAASLNALPGSSAYYMGSVIAYDNSIKQQVLGVREETLMQEGAVSKATVCQMAEGVRRLMHTDYAIATSGIAGPSGGTKDKPVGTVWIAWADRNGCSAECYHFGAAREREQITQRAVTAALVGWIKRRREK